MRLLITIFRVWYWRLIGRVCIWLYSRGEAAMIWYRKHTELGVFGGDVQSHSVETDSITTPPEGIERTEWLNWHYGREWTDVAENLHLDPAKLPKPERDKTEWEK